MPIWTRRTASLRVGGKFSHRVATPWPRERSASCRDRSDSRTTQRTAVEWMRWSAFSGQLTIEYQQRDTALVIDYPLPSGHKPSAAAPWSDTTNADPVNDLKTWLSTVVYDAGSPGRKIHLSDEDSNSIVSNQKLRDILQRGRGAAVYANRRRRAASCCRPVRSSSRPTMPSVTRAVGGSKAPSDHTRYLPVGNVLITTDYTIDGLPSRRPSMVRSRSRPVPTRHHSFRVRSPRSSSRVRVSTPDCFGRRLAASCGSRRPEAFLYADVA